MAHRVRLSTRRTYISRHGHALRSILCVLSFSMRLLENRKTATQREIYYAFVRHFAHQVAPRTLRPASYATVYSSGGGPRIPVVSSRKYSLAQYIYVTSSFHASPCVSSLTISLRVNPNLRSKTLISPIQAVRRFLHGNIPDNTSINADRACGVFLGVLSLVECYEPDKVQRRDLGLLRPSRGTPPLPRHCR